MSLKDSNKEHDYDASKTGLFFGLFLIPEVGTVIALVSFYKSPVYSVSALQTKFGLLFSVGILLTVTGIIAILAKTRATDSYRSLTIGALANLLTVASVFTVAELGLRILIRDTADGVMVGNVMLRPTWNEIKTSSRHALDAVSRTKPWEVSYFVYDQELGWTVGDNRSSGNELYFSSAEGIRSPREGVAYRDTEPSRRIAMIGDSHTFSLGVSFEDSWSHHLAQLLNDDVQVLNFGVDGYGLDQILLRYQRDVPDWQPDVVIVSFIHADMVRTMSVYPFISHNWPGYMVKPRMEFDDSDLRVINYPLPSSDVILGTDLISDLPYIENDPGYAKRDWKWRFPNGPILFRLLSTLSPRWPPADDRFSTESQVSLNAAILRQTYDEILANGSLPLIIHLSSEPSNAIDAMLGKAQIPYLDLTDCLSSIPPQERFVEDGHHQSGKANAAFAKCIVDDVIRLLNSRDNTQSSGI